MRSPGFLVFGVALLLAACGRVDPGREYTNSFAASRDSNAIVVVGVASQVPFVRGGIIGNSFSVFWQKYDPVTEQAESVSERLAITRDICNTTEPADCLTTTPTYHIRAVTPGHYILTNSTINLHRRIQTTYYIRDRYGNIFAPP